MSSTHGREEVAKQVLRHFLRNPQSADTLEGIVHWRLLEERIHHTLVETQSALERLVAEGYLHVVSAGSKNIYTLNTTKRKEAEEFVGTVTHDG